MAWTTEELIKRIDQLKIRQFRNQLRAGKPSDQQLYRMSGGMMKSDAKDEHRSEMQRRVHGADKV